VGQEHSKKDTPIEISRKNIGTKEDNSDKGKICLGYILNNIELLLKLLDSCYCILTYSPFLSIGT